MWSTGDGYHGDPNSLQWKPKFCDPQLFQEHVWFWEPDLKVRTLAMLIPIYHDIVGRGMTMELAFSIDRDGLVQDTHAAMYRALGNWVRGCYGSPVAETDVATPYVVAILVRCIYGAHKQPKARLQLFLAPLAPLVFATHHRMCKYHWPHSPQGVQIPLLLSLHSCVIF